MRVLAPLAKHMLQQTTRTPRTFEGESHPMSPSKKSRPTERCRKHKNKSTKACIKAGAFPKPPTTQTQRQARSWCSPTSTPCRNCSGHWPIRSKSCSSAGSCHSNRATGLLSSRRRQREERSPSSGRPRSGPNRPLGSGNGRNFS